ncbi:AraC family transcriptional regulator [Mycolicibacterium psychrotolerans]|uniref:AraC family transcriptional regulator n=1 Tax=Mycolicibacterium psychrotolerans TaxID=216929 RepID=UPI003D66FD53
MSVVRATSLSNFPRLVSDLGGDPVALLKQAGIDPGVVGDNDIFIPLSRVVAAIETAAKSTDTLDFGRRLALVQGIEILGPVGVAARTSGTVAEALRIFERFLAAYSPGLLLQVCTTDDPERAFIDYQVLDTHIDVRPQTAELSLGVILRVLRFLLGDDYRPLSVELPYEALTDVDEYWAYFGCRPLFSSARMGFTIRSADLQRPLQRDQLAHDIIVQYLTTITAAEPSTTTSVRALVRQLLPSGTVTLELIAEQLSLHPKALQRRLAAEATSFAAVIDGVRRERAERYLRDTGITLAHLARELGYAEHSVLTRSCHRWFGLGPAAYRKQLQLR